MVYEDDSVGAGVAHASGMPNQLNVAKAANVSIATVSRVLNNSSNVRESLRSRVLEVMAGLDDAPNGAARSLASRQSRTMVAIVPTLKSDLFARDIDALIPRLRKDDDSLKKVPLLVCINGMCR